MTTVVEKCLSIQTQHDNYQVSEDINLRMKLSVGVGDVFVYHLGMYCSVYILLGYLCVYVMQAYICVVLFICAVFMFVCACV